MAKVHNQEFFFFLDAWHYCTEHNLTIDRITRRDWKTWVVK